MRTRCPACETVFRITSEQLRAKAGRVRCGTCHHVFNAFDHLIEEVPPLSAAGQPEKPDFPPEASSARLGAAADPVVGAAAPETPDPAPELLLEEDSAVAAVSKELPDPVDEAIQEALPEPAATDTVNEETPEQSADAARQAGLMAAREITEAPGYNRWAAGTLAGNSRSVLVAPSSPPAIWPFALVALLLLLSLALQVAYHYRTEVVQRLPEARAAFAALDIPVPLPHQVDLVGIEASDLQADNARGMLVLQATLKNRASFAQAWPALELALTDTHDSVVARRVLQAADYLPPGANPGSFAANGEAAVRLWIEAKGLGAAGYRLYIFYP